MLANQPEAFLQFGRNGIFEPEEMMRLERLAEPRRLDWRQPMVRVVEQVHVGSELVPDALEESGNDREVPLGAPRRFQGLGLFRGFVEQRAAADAVRVRHPRHAALRADRAVAKLNVFPDGRHRVVDRLAVGVPVNHHRFP